ncbi:MAG TPA: DUF6603 domain-containing protein [Trebonia sp.]
MNLSDVAARLQQLIGQDGTLPLDPALFARPEFTSLHDALTSVLAAVGVSRLRVTGAHVAGTTEVTVDGEAALFGTKPGTIHLQVTGTDKLTATLAFTAPKGWGFADGFPGLPSSYQDLAATPGLIVLAESVLYDFSLASAVLTATSASPELAFAGSLASASVFSFLASALSLPAQPALTGTIRRSGDASAIPNLAVEVGSSTLQIGDLLKLTAIGLHAHTVQADPSTGQAMTSLDLNATIEAGTQDPVQIKLSAPLYGLAQGLALSADFGDKGLSVGRGVRAFAELLRLDPGSFTLPDPLNVLEQFALYSMTCTVTLDPPEVLEVALTVGPPQSWPITTGIEVDDLKASWSITYPFDPAGRRMSASIAGTLALGTVDPKLKFDVLATSAARYSVSGDLMEPMTLEQIATTVNGSPVAGLPDLEVLAASISASTNGDFGVAVGLGDWAIGSVGRTPIVLSSVLASLERQAGVTTGQFLTVLGVGEALLYLSAKLRMSAQAPAGWIFDGGTQPDTTLGIGDLITELATTFGIDHVPDELRSLQLTQLNLHYDTAQSHFTFAAQASFTAGPVPVTAALSVDVAPAKAAAEADPYAASVVGSEGYSATFRLQLTLAGYPFDVVFGADGAGSDVLIADYHKPSADPVELQALVAGLSADLAQAIPPGISLELHEIKFVFLKQAASQWAFGVRLGAGFDLTQLPVIGSHLPADATLGVQGLQILYSSASLTADQTKIINPLLPDGVAKLPDTVGKGISFDADVMLGTASKHLHAAITPPEQAQTRAEAALPDAEAARPDAVPVLEGTVVPRAAAPIPASSTDPVTWLDINKQFGIFSFQRVGVGYEKNRLELALDASVALGPLALSMQALSVSSELTKFDPEFSLRGLGLMFSRPPIAVGGAFLKVPETVGDRTFDSYYGQLIVQVGTFSLKALGGWAPDADPALFFIYLSISAPLGGPPFLFVTGLSGGFGINSSLVLPPIDKVGSCQLLPGQAPPEQETPAATIEAAIDGLKETFRPQGGQYWVAAGIAFTSFEMIEARAVVSVAFGVDLQIGVIGTCAMTFPAGDAPSPVAYIEIDVVASFTPSTGLLSVDGKLSPASYLLGGFVQLTGGFAFYAWFSGEHQGDFVVSIGGYHPAFAKPDNYPAVPRLGLAFSLGPVKVTGQAYFALTPGMFMAGLRLSATFETDSIRAWFDAGVDFVLAWAPFHYEARSWVTIGCSVDLGLFTTSVQIGADLQLWGPEFGGEAVVDLDVASFTIAFGQPRTPPAPVGWDTFAKSFLPPPEPAAQSAAQSAAQPAPRLARAAGPGAAAPAPEPVPNILKASVTTGLISTSDAVDWILDPDHFRILTASTIPANHGLWSTSAASTAELPNAVSSYGRAAAPVTDLAVPAGAMPPEMLLQLDYGAVTYSGTRVWAPELNIGPMKRAKVASYLTVTVRKRQENGQLADYVTGVTVTPQLTASNTALWGAPPDTGPDDSPGINNPNAERLIPATLTGLAISPVPRHPDRISDVSLESLIFGEGRSTGFGYQHPVVDGPYTVTSTISDDGHTFTIDVPGGPPNSLENHDYELSALTDPWVAGQRSATLQELNRLGFGTARADTVQLSQMADTALTDWPSATRIGSETSA